MGLSAGAPCTGSKGLLCWRAVCQSGRCPGIFPSKSKPNPKAVQGSSSQLLAACARPLSRLPHVWGGNVDELSPQNTPRLPNLGTLHFYHHPARGLGAEMQLMKALVQIDSTELVCLMWGGGMVAGGRGERRAPSQPPLKHAGLGIWSEPASLAGAVFPSAHTCAFCLSAVFPPISLH